MLIVRRFACVKWERLPFNQRLHNTIIHQTLTQSIAEPAFAAVGRPQQVKRIHFSCYAVQPIKHKRPELIDRLNCMIELVRHPAFDGVNGSINRHILQATKRAENRIFGTFDVFEVDVMDIDHKYHAFD